MSGTIVTLAEHTPLAEEMLRTFLARREEMAAKVFAPANVLKLMTDHSVHGRVRIRQRQPVDLSRTVAARQLLELLAEKGYAAQWVAITPAGEHHDEEPYKELVIGWSPRATSGHIGSLRLARDTLVEMHRATVIPIERKGQP